MFLTIGQSSSFKESSFLSEKIASLSHVAKPMSDIIKQSHMTYLSIHDVQFGCFCWNSVQIHLFFRVIKM